MWVITQTGFYSAVQVENEPNILKVRTRTYNDATALAVFMHGTDYEQYIIADAGTDYKYRVLCSKQDWIEFLAATTQDIDYTNFKSRVFTEQGEARADLYHDVWAVLFQLQTKHDRGAPSKSLKPSAS
jgi:hypothetical protein